MVYEGPRRQGRFLKKGSKVLEKVSLQDFRFEEINDAHVVTLDNSKRTIIHSQYHEESELKESVRTPERFNDELVSNDQKRIVIQPTDFTAEWERTKKLRKDRVMRAGDDEEFDFEYEAAQRAEAEALAASAALAAEAAPAEAANAASLQMQPAVSAAKAPVSPARAAIPQPATEAPRGSPVGGMVTGSDKQWEYMDQVGQAIKSLNHSAQEAPSQPAQRPGQEASEPQDDFIPVSGHSDSPAAVDPEVAAARAYQRRQEIEQENKAVLDELAEEAKARGYREGFRMGEEKADVQVRQNASQVFGKVTELIQEFGNLKHVVLDNVQENFYELCQAMAEALIKREFTIHPEAFVTVLRRAISETVETGKFRIKVHPEMYDRLVALGDAEGGIRESLVKDSEIPPGDFKIESDLSVVDVSVGKMIGELLQQADLQLFGNQESEKAS